MRQGEPRLAVEPFDESVSVFVRPDRYAQLTVELEPACRASASLESCTVGGADDDQGERWDVGEDEDGDGRFQRWFLSGE